PGGKIRRRATPAPGHPRREGNCARLWNREDSDVDSQLFHEAVERLNVANGHAGTRAPADLPAVHVEERGHPEALRVEVRRVGEGLAELARSGDAEGVGDAEAHEVFEVGLEIGDAVPDATHAELAELGEVLPDLGGVEREP